MSKRAMTERNETTIVESLFSNHQTLVIHVCFDLLENPNLNKVTKKSPTFSNYSGLIFIHSLL